MIIAFAWGAFWIGAVAGAVSLVIAVLIYFSLTDEEMAKNRAARRKMNENARQARQELYREELERVKKEEL